MPKIKTYFLLYFTRNLYYFSNEKTNDNKDSIKHFLKIKIIFSVTTTGFINLLLSNINVGHIKLSLSKYMHKK